MGFLYMALGIENKKPARAAGFCGVKANFT
jgi:hypothetical protein